MAVQDISLLPQAASNIEYFHWFCNNCLGMQVMMSVLLHREGMEEKERRNCSNPLEFLELEK